MRLSSTPELEALSAATNPNLFSVTIHLDETRWGEVAKRRVLALQQKTAAEYWNRAARDESDNDRYKRFAREDAQKARDLLPPRTKHLGRAQVLFMIIEVARRELPQI